MWYIYSSQLKHANKTVAGQICVQVLTNELWMQFETNVILPGHKNKPKLNLWIPLWQNTLILEQISEPFGSEKSCYPKFNDKKFSRT